MSKFFVKFKSISLAFSADFQIATYIFSLPNILLRDRLISHLVIFSHLVKVGHCAKTMAAGHCAKTMA